MLNNLLEKLMRKTGILKNLIFRRKINIKGKKINIPVILELSCQLSETWMIELLEKILPEKEGVFLDIGVNLGQTLIKVKSIEPTRKYIGFEPNSVCVFYVKHLIKNNQFENCTLLPVGLFTEDSILSLESINDSEVDAAASIIKNFRPNQIIRHQTFVPVFCFENIANILDIDKIGIVKIDVEGAELEVIKSLQVVIHHDRPIFILEVLPVYSNENKARKERQEELERIFNLASYSFFRVSKTREGNFINCKPIDSIGIHSDLNQCDYLVVPSEFTGKMQGVLQEAVAERLLATL
ncbi:methyltransferase [Calothrix sp. NIES-4101]|nr:methyltransferase [Calothrix sp. NIES-4101]